MAGRRQPASKLKQRWALGFVLVLAGLSLLFGIIGLLHANDALAGRGRPGTFTALSEHCRKSGCTWRGDFLRDDGTSRADVKVAEGSGLHAAGQTVRASDVGDGSTVYPLREEARRDPLAAVLASSTVLVGALAGGAAALRRRGLQPLPHAQRAARSARRGVIVFSVLAVESAVLAWLTDGSGPWFFSGFGLLLAWMAAMSRRSELRATRR